VKVKVRDLEIAVEELEKFRKYSISPLHERYIFPLLRGTYFSYRKLDVLRVAAIAKALSVRPKYCDVGCGSGDFLMKVREYIPDAIGIERSADLVYRCHTIKPDFINITDARWGFTGRFDIVFVGWMEPGIDLRDAISDRTDVIVTTLDQGISLAAEFDGHGYTLVASWRTPSWEDVNIEIMNKYYTQMSNNIYTRLSKLRGAHNLWYIYSRKQSFETVKESLMKSLQLEQEDTIEKYDFEEVLDGCGFNYLEEIKTFCSRNQKRERLWDIRFINTRSTWDFCSGT
jgi:hypothetical protein